MWWTKMYPAWFWTCEDCIEDLSEDCIADHMEDYIEDLWGQTCASVEP